MATVPTITDRRPRDPYLEWAELTSGDYLRTGSKGPWRIAVRADQAKAMSAAARQSLQLQTPRSPNDAVQGWLGMDSDLAAVVDGLPGILLTEPGMFPYRMPSKQPAAAPAGERVAPQPAPAGTVLGIIDGRCGFLSEAFTAWRGQLIHAYWDQSTATAPAQPWRRPSDMGYGRELDAAALRRVSRRFGLNQRGLARPQRQALERQAYQTLDFMLPAEADWSHGTHVLSTVLDEMETWRGDRSLSAPLSRVVVVQIPDDALMDTSARWTGSYVLDALDYILARSDPGSRIVVNISLGSFAGPHDGSSLVEREIDQRIAALDGRLTVVVAAGNAGRIVDDGTGQQVVCHRHLALKEGETIELFFHVDVGDTTETFLELWSDAGSQLSLCLTHEVSGLGSGWVDPAHTGTLTASDGTVLAALINGAGQATARGDGDQALVALRHTLSTHGEPVAPTGRWKLSVRTNGDRPVGADAWFERRDVPGELPGYRPQHGFVLSADEREAAQDRQQALVHAKPGVPLPAPARFAVSGNLCSLANGMRTVVVGAFDAINLVAEYSSTGPSRLQREVDVLCGGQHRGVGFLSQTDKELKGTSMAAARVSGALLALLSGAQLANDELRELDKRASLRCRGLGMEGALQLNPPAE